MTEPRTRRAFLEALISGAAGLTIAPPVFGQGRGPAPITATKLTDRSAVLSGAGGSVGVLFGNEGILTFARGGRLTFGGETARPAAEFWQREPHARRNTRLT